MSEAHLTPENISILRKMAGGITRGQPSMFDDVLQEGLISTWKLNDHASTGYMIVTARHAMNGVLTRGNITSIHSDRRYEMKDVGYLEDLLPAALGADGPQGAVEIAVDVREAVSALPERHRQLVERMLQLDSGPTVAAVSLGRPKRSAVSSWTHRIKPRLVKSLAA